MGIHEKMDLKTIVHGKMINSTPFVKFVDSLIKQNDQN